MPVCAIAAAPPTASSRFFGLAPEKTAASPSAAGGEVLSIVAIHAGICGSSSPRGLLRNWRAATSSTSAPRTILTQLTHMAGDPDSLARPTQPGPGRWRDKAEANQPAEGEGRAVDLGPAAGKA